MRLISKFKIREGLDEVVIAISKTLLDGWVYFFEDTDFLKAKPRQASATRWAMDLTSGFGLGHSSGVTAGSFYRNADYPQGFPQFEQRNREAPSVSRIIVVERPFGQVQQLLFEPCKRELRLDKAPAEAVKFTH